MMNRINHIRSQSGFSLLEVLLSVGVGAIIVLGAARLAQDWAERIRHREEASYLMTVNEAAKSYVTTNFGSILQDGFLENLNNITQDDVADNAAMVNVGRSILIPMENEGARFYLKDGTIGLAANFPGRSPLGRTPQVYVRHLGSIGGQLTLQIITATTVENQDRARPLTALAVNDIARAIGPEAGTFSSRNGCNGEIASVFGNWVLSASTISDSSRLMGSMAPYCPPSNEPRGVGDYVVLQDRITYASVASNDYLYRVPISGMPMANQMETNLDMNNHGVVNVSSLSVDNMLVDGNAYIAGAGGTAMFVDEAMRVSGPGSRIAGTSNNLTASGGTLRTENLAISALNPDARLDEDLGLGPEHLALNAPRMEVDRNLNIFGNLAVGNTLDISAGTLTTPQAVGIATVIKPEGTITSRSFQVAAPTTVNSISAGQLTTGVLDVGGQLTASDFEVTDAIRFGGNASVGGALSVQEMQMRRLDGCTATVIYDWTQRRYVRTGNAYDCEQGPQR